MNTKTSATFSLNNLVWVSLAGVIGVGNFFSSPAHIAKVGAANFFLAHLVSLFFICGPLLCAEVLWGKWLRRSLPDAFAVAGNRWKPLSIVVLITLGVTMPPYIYTFSEFITKLVHFLGYTHFSWRAYDAYRASLFYPYLCSVVIVAMSILLSSLSRKLFARLTKTLLLACFIAWIITAIFVLTQWGPASHFELLKVGLYELSLNDLSSISNFSFYSATLGCGVFFILVQWLPKKRIEEGGINKLCFYIVIVDFLVSILAFVILAPFLRYGQEIRFSTLFLDLIPYSMMYTKEGLCVLVCFYLSLFTAGLLAITVLMRVSVENIQQSLTKDRKEALMRVSWWSPVALILPILPSVKNTMSLFSTGLLMPLSALIFALVVMIKMPRKSQNLILGRGFLLDPMIKIWRFSTKYLVIPFLLWNLVKFFVR